MQLSWPRGRLRRGGEQGRLGQPAQASVEAGTHDVSVPRGRDHSATAEDRDGLPGGRRRRPPAREVGPAGVRCATTHSTHDSRCGWPRVCSWVWRTPTNSSAARLTDEQAEQFYRSAWTLGTTLQVIEEQWPPTRDRLRRLLDHCVPQRRHRRHRARLPTRPGRVQDDQSAFWGCRFRPLVKFLTAGFLAPVFRDALGLRMGPDPAIGRSRCCSSSVAFANRFLPVFIRQGGSYLLLVDVRRRRRPPTSG